MSGDLVGRDSVEPYYSTLALSRFQRPESDGREGFVEQCEGFARQFAGFDEAFDRGAIKPEVMHRHRLADDAGGIVRGIFQEIGESNDGTGIFDGQSPFMRHIVFQHLALQSHGGNHALGRQAVYHRREPLE